MHLTTFVSLLAVGVAAAPARQVDNTEVATPALPIRRQEAATTGSPSFRDHVAEGDRQAAAEKDPLDAYLETFDGEGEWDQEAHDKALDRYNKAVENEDAELTKPKLTEPEHGSNSTANSTAPIEARAVEVPTTASDAKSPETTVDPLDAYLETFDDESSDEKSQDEALDHYLKNFETKSAEPTNATSPAVEPKTGNFTTEEAAAPKNESSKGALDQMMRDLDLKKLMGKEPKADAAKNETSVEPSAAKNETSTEPAAAAKDETASAAPAKKSSSSGPLSGLTGGLPVKRQTVPTVAGTDSLKDILPKRQIPTPELPELPEIQDATESFKRQAEDVQEAEKNVTSTAANSTAAANETAADDGFHGINKHMAKLDKLDALPIGGLPVKREAFEEGARFETRFEELDQEQGASPSSGKPDFPQQQGAAQPSGKPVAQDQGFAAPSGTPVVQHQGFPSQAAPKPTAAPARAAQDGESKPARDARMNRSVKAVYKTDKPSAPQAKPTGSPLDKFLVPLKRQQEEPEADFDPETSSEDFHAAEQAKPSEAASKPDWSSTVTKFMKSSEEKPAQGPPSESSSASEKKPEIKPETEEEASPLAGLLGESEKKPARGPSSESKPTAESEAKPEPKSEPKSEETSPLAGLTGASEKKPARGPPAKESEQAPTEPKSEKPSFLDSLSSEKKPAGPPAAKPASASESAPAESSSAPASPLAGLTG